MFHFTTTTKARENYALVITNSQMERIIFPIAHEGMSLLLEAVK